MRKYVFLTVIAVIAAMPSFATAQTKKGSNGGLIVKSQGHPIEFVHKGVDIVSMWGTTMVRRFRQRICADAQRFRTAARPSPFRLLPPAPT